MECAVFGRLAGAGAAERALKDAAEGVGKYGKIWENVCVCDYGVDIGKIWVSMVT